MKMINSDYSFCLGNNCEKKESCKRYQLAQKSNGGWFLVGKTEKECKLYVKSSK